MVSVKSETASRVADGEVSAGIPSDKLAPSRARKSGKPERSKTDRSKAERSQAAFQDYFDYRERLQRVPPHRILAINRGERAKVLRVRVEADLDQLLSAATELLVSAEHPHAEFLVQCARDALDRLILPSLEREIRRELTESAEEHAVHVAVFIIAIWRRAGHLCCSSTS